MRNFSVGLFSIAACVMWTLGGCTQQPQQEGLAGSDADAQWSAGAGKAPGAKTLYALAKIQIDQGKDDAAQYLLEKIVRDHPSFSPAYVDLAEIHMRKRNPDLAIETLSAGLRVNPRDGAMMNDMGMCYIVKGSYDKAFTMFQQASGAVPGDTRFRSNMALALGMMGRYEESLALFEQLLQPQDAHHNLAVICEARKDFDRAAMEWELAKMSFSPAAKKSAGGPATRPGA